MVGRKESMAINTEVLAQVRDLILAEPQRYDQEHFVRLSKDAPCGTAACILGWIDLLTNQEAAAYFESEGDLPVGVCARAAKVTGLTSDDVRRIAPMDAGDWPEPFRRQFRKARTRKARACAAANLIDHIIKTGKVTD